MNELPSDFPHSPPEGYSYELSSFKKNVTAVWLRHPNQYNYTSDVVRTVWGFIKTTKKGMTYHAPVNCKKVGDVVNIDDTTPYTAMQLNLSPLERLLMS